MSAGEDWGVSATQTGLSSDDGDACVSALRASIPNAGYSLCYASGAFLYFTLLPLSKQWGDDWDDAPYEHNAGTPYERDGASILALAWDGNFELPGQWETNSRWSVQDINAGAVAWLSESWVPKGGKRAIVKAGASPAEVAAILQARGGNVYLPAQGMSTRSAETEGLSPQDASPVRDSECAQGEPQ